MSVETIIKSEPTNKEEDINPVEFLDTSLEEDTDDVTTIKVSACTKNEPLRCTKSESSMPNELSCMTITPSSNFLKRSEETIIKQESVVAYDVVDPTEFLATNLEEDTVHSETIKSMSTTDDLSISTTNDTLSRTSIGPSAICGEKCCRFCGKNFKRNSELNRHLLVHLGQRPYQCEICHKVFSRKSNLDRHVLTHTDERLFKCDFCEKSCRSKDDLSRHKLVHNGARLYKCYLCEKSFPIKGRLKEHLLIHTGQRAYKCDVCNKCFTKRNNLNRHTLVHTGKRDYQCDVCEKSFKQKSHLIEHTTIHSGQFEYYCDICEKPFARKTNFKRHMQTHKI